MRKTIKVSNVKPPSEIELQFEGGESILLRFDMNSFLNINNFENEKLIFNEESITDTCAMVIYLTGKDNNEDFTHDKAKQLTSLLDLMTITEILNEFAASLGTNEVTKESVKKLMGRLSILN